MKKIKIHKTKKTNFAISQFWEAKKEVDNAWLNFNFVDNKNVEAAIYRLIAAEIDFNQMCCRIKKTMKKDSTF